jgi:hypothetical protein
MADFVYLMKKAAGVLTAEDEQAERARVAAEQQQQQLRGAPVQAGAASPVLTNTRTDTLTGIANTGVHPAQQGAMDAVQREMQLQEEIRRLRLRR